MLNIGRGSRGGETGEFSPSPTPLLSFLHHADAQTSNTSTRLWFYYIITKIHPPPRPFQNPESAPEYELSRGIQKATASNTSRREARLSGN